MLWVEEESKRGSGVSRRMGWSPRWFSDKRDGGEGLGCGDWLAGVVERGYRGFGREGRVLASRWRGEWSPLARGGERGEMSGEEGVVEGGDVPDVWGQVG